MVLYIATVALALVVGVIIGDRLAEKNWREVRTLNSEPKTRDDLIGLKGMITRNVTVVDAKEYPTGVSIRVCDDMGEEYWTDLEDADLNC